MRTHFPNDPAGLRSRAEFFQRLACAARSIPVREELEELSLKSMDEAAALERELAIPAVSEEMARTNTPEEQRRHEDCSKK
jgi:hypothetical protein